MSTVLILSRDPLPEEGHIATGGGLRSLSILKGLESKGHVVFIAYPEKIFNCLPELKKEKKIYSYSVINIDTIIKKTAPDVIIQECIGDIEHLKNVSVPIVFDIPGPRLLESGYLNTSLEKDIQNKIESFALGDYFIFSNERQKIYSISWLMLAGVDLNKKFAGIVSYSTSNILPEKIHENLPKEPTFVWGGIFWPWQNCTNTLNIVLSYIDSKNSGYLKIIGGSFPFKYSKIKKFSNFIPSLGKSSRLQSLGLLPYNKMLKLYTTKATIAIDLADNSCERELASPFRTIDYLSCGLPVIINKSVPISELIIKYKAGWAINPENIDELKNILKTIYENPELVIEYSKNAQKLIREHFIWGKKIDDLDIFCKNPVKRKKHKPVFENIIKFNTAKRFREEGYYIKAIEELSKINNGNYVNEWVHFELAITYKESKNYKKALYELNTENKLFPGKAPVKTETGNIYLLLKQYKQATDAFKESLQIDPQWPFTHYSIACVFMEEQKFDKALNHLKKTGPNFPLKEWADYNTAIALMKTGRYDPAIAGFEKTSKTFDLRAYVLYHLGSILKVKKNLNDSTKYFIEILNGDIDMSSIEENVSTNLIAGTHFHLGEIYKTLKKNKAALIEFNACLKINPNHKKAKEYLHKINE